MKLTKRVIILITFSVIGIIITNLLHSAYLNGLFAKWEPIGKPPSEVVKLIGLGYVQTESGDIYQYTSKPNCNDNCWLKTHTAPYLRKEFWLPLDECVDVPSLDKFVDSIAICEMYGIGTSLTIDAIDKNGEVYSWNHSFMGGYSDLIIPYIGALIGFITGFFFLLVNSPIDYQRQQDKTILEKE